jgi:hypothetical protein
MRDEAAAMQQMSRDGSNPQLRVWIDDDLPADGIPWLLGQLFGRWYAKFCMRQMVQDAQRSFAT